MQQSLYGPALRGLFSALGADVVLKVVGLAASIIVLQQLDPYQYGLWQIILGISVAFAVVTFPGIASMLVADVSREIGAGNHRRANGIIVKASFLFVVLSSIGAIAMFIAAPQIKAFSGIDVVDLARLLAVSVFAIGVRQAYALLFTSRLQFVHAQSIKGIDRIAYFLALVFFVLLGEGGFVGVAYAYTVASVAPLIIYAPYMVRMLMQSYANHEAGEWGPFRQAVFGRGRWVVGTDIINSGLSALWPWVVGFYLGVEAVGIIGIALLLMSQTSSFVPIASVLRAILPRTIDSAGRTKEWLMRAMKASLWGTITAGVVIFLAAAALFPVLFPQHTRVLPLFAALLLALPLRSVATTTAEWFYSSRRQRDLFFITSLPKALIFMTLPLFISTGGLLGYAAWYLISSDIILYARLRVVRKHTGYTEPLSALFRADAVDVELIERARELIGAKLRGFRG